MSINRSSETGGGDHFLEKQRNRKYCGEIGNIATVKSQQSSMNSDN